MFLSSNILCKYQIELFSVELGYSMLTFPNRIFWRGVSGFAIALQISVCIQNAERESQLCGQNDLLMKFLHSYIVHKT